MLATRSERESFHPISRRQQQQQRKLNYTIHHPDSWSGLLKLHSWLTNTSIDGNNDHLRCFCCLKSHPDHFKHVVNNLSSILKPLSSKRYQYQLTLLSQSLLLSLHLWMTFFRLFLKTIAFCYVIVTRVPLLFRRACNEPRPICYLQQQLDVCCCVLHFARRKLLQL